MTANPSGTTPYTFNVTLSQASSVPITINYDTSNGTGTAGVDYTAVSNGSLTIPAGQTTGQITIQVMNDTNASGNPTFNVVLTGGTSVTIASPITATGTILDTQTVTTANASVTASTSAATTMTFTPTLSHAVGQDVIISYTETDGSGTSGAKAGTDYTATTGTVTIPAGSLTPTTPIQIPVALQTVYEGTKTFTLNLSITSGPTNAGLSNTTATGTINPAVAEPSLSISPSVASLQAPNGQTNPGSTSNYTFTVTLSAASGVPTTVNYATSDGPAPNGGAVAVGGVDYQSMLPRSPFRPVKPRPKSMSRSTRRRRTKPPRASPSRCRRR